MFVVIMVLRFGMMGVFGMRTERFDVILCKNMSLSKSNWKSIIEFWSISKS